MSFSVWTETRDKKESEQSQVFHLFSHDKGVFHVAAHAVGSVFV